MLLGLFAEATLAPHVEGNDLMIDPFTLARYFELREEVEAAAERLLVRYRELFSAAFGDQNTRVFLDSGDHVSFVSVTTDELLFEGDETWNYGGHEHHTLMLPTSYLTDPAWEDALRARFAAELAGQAERERRQVESIGANERRLLRELSAKYPDALQPPEETTP